MWSQLAINLTSGDWYIYCMLAFGWVGLVILIERVTMIFVVYNLDFKKFLQNFRKMIQAEDVDRAMNLCKKASKTSLPHISLKALEASETDPSTVKGIIEEETIDFLPRVEARLGALPGLATLVLLIGILGSIDNLWAAFHSINVLDTAEKQASLSGGIAASLTHTALGLMISIILISGHHVLRGAALRLIERLHHGITVISNLLAPQETGSFIPVGAMPMMAGQAPLQAGESTPETETAEEAEEDLDDGFDDAAVEDIKDEEEII